MPESTARSIGQERTWLAQEYGRLFGIINRWGGMMMGSPALGTTSRDVVQDAIHDIGTIFYNDLARLSVQHLDTVIGRLTGRAERYAEPAVKSEDLYRWTSPVFWVQRLAAGVGWLLATGWRRALTGLGAVALVVIGGIASGWAGAVFGR
jgi:hypothetical protein